VSVVTPADGAPLSLADLPPLRERLIALCAVDGQGRAALAHRLLLLRAWTAALAALTADHRPAHDVHLVAGGHPRRMRGQARPPARPHGTERGTDGAE